jgi:hypothetical protein
MTNIIELEDLPELGKKHLDKIEEINSTYSILKAMPKDRHDTKTFRGPSVVAFKMKVFNEASLRRVLDLSESAALCWKSKNHIATFLLLRGLLENAALILYLSNQILGYCKNLDEVGLERLIDPILYGSSHPKAVIKVPRIKKAITYSNEIFTGFSDEYDRLCDFTHPNGIGMAYFYGRMKREPELAYETINPENEFTTNTFILSMHYSMSIFKMSHNHLDEYIPFAAEIKNQIRQNEEGKIKARAASK